MQAAAQDWFGRATSRWQDWDAARLVQAKGAHRIAVVIPARDEAPTIGGIVEGVRTELVERHALVDELVVIDSDSSDSTADLARAAGASVHAARSIRADLDSFAGKGEALWKSLFVTTADLLVFIDADLTEWGPHFVVGLLGPLLSDPQVHLVKGFYDRVLDDGSGMQAPQGGRVTELVARPLLNLYRPELSRVVQPLAGEWAIRRAAFETLSVPVGYGVEIASLLDVYARDGLDAIAQVDLGERAHSHQSVHDLGVMAAEVIAVALRRLGLEVEPDDLLWQFSRASGSPWTPRDVPRVERAPAVTMGGARW
ncbi:MAG: glucosyl-3-phosphoglycerate synthase [Pseudonocardiales bacterium]|nr:glucosyl-3-phosphoglycerate synthase [Pseudonocardiales bacterium]